MASVPQNDSCAYRQWGECTVKEPPVSTIRTHLAARCFEIQHHSETRRILHQRLQWSGDIESSKERTHDAPVSWMQAGGRFFPMKGVVKKIIAASVNYPIARRAYDGCGVLGHYLSQIQGHARFVQENTRLEQELARLARQLFPELQVQKRPFEGLRYPSLQSVASASQSMIF
jgi:hypothetical protein